MILGLQGEAAAAEALLEELADGNALHTLVNKVHLPAGRGAVALGRGDGAGAVEALKGSGALDRSWLRLLYLRGLAYLQEGQPAEALADFGTVLERKMNGQNIALAPLAQLGIARGHVLAGDEAAARVAYQELLERWAAADASIPVVRAAREEYETLR